MKFYHRVPWLYGPFLVIENGYVTSWGGAVLSIMVTKEAYKGNDEGNDKNYATAINWFSTIVKIGVTTWCSSALSCRIINSYYYHYFYHQ